MIRALFYCLARLSILAAVTAACIVLHRIMMEAQQ